MDVQCPEPVKSRVPSIECLYQKNNDNDNYNNNDNGDDDDDDDDDKNNNVIYLLYSRIVTNL